VGSANSAGLFGQLALGAAFEFERQVNVFHFLLGCGVVNSGQQHRRELALFVNGFAHHFFAVAQLTQVGQAGFQLSQLDVVQPIGHLFAVAGNKRHRGTFVQELDSGFHLVGTNTDFLRDLRDDFLHKRGEIEIETVAIQ
jgi:hypothetical protein